MSAPAAGAWRIRAARSDDLTALVELELAAFPHPWGEDLVADEMRQPQGILLVAEDDRGAVRAYAAFRLGAGEGELLRIATAPECRGRGAARGLLGIGLARLQESGARRCHLEVRAANADAIRLYQAAGFRRVGARKGYYADGADAILFALHLGGRDDAG